MRAALTLDEMNGRLSAGQPTSRRALSLDEMDAAGTSAPAPEQSAEQPGRLVRMVGAVGNRLMLPDGERPDLTERFKVNAIDAFRNGTLAGTVLNDWERGKFQGQQAIGAERALAEARSAGSAVGLPNFSTGEPSPFDSVPLDQLEAIRSRTGAVAAAKGQQFATDEAARRQREQSLPPWQGPVEGLVSLGGQLAGSAPTPESLVPVSRGSTLARTFAKGAAVNAGVTGATDPLVQAGQIERGARAEYYPLQTIAGMALAAPIGGALNVAPHLLAPVVKPAMEAAGNVARPAMEAFRAGADAVGNRARLTLDQMQRLLEQGQDAAPRQEPYFSDMPRNRATESTESISDAPAPGQPENGGGAVASPNGRETASPQADGQPASVPPSGQFPPSSMGVQSSDRVFTPSGRSIEVRPELVEADSLISSHTDDLTTNPRFPAELQPRDRSRAASQAQIADMAANLNPELLGRSATVTDGAPIIGPDGVVESGNARVLGIRRAYGQNPDKATAYRAWLASQGFDPSGFRNPVLVRRRITDLSPADREAFTREANARTTASMSASEMAMADARNLPDTALDLYRGGDVLSGTNVPFVRKFMEGLPQAERAALMTPEGGLSQEGARRIQNSLFAKAYDDPELLAALREHPDSNFKAIGEALVDVAPAIARNRTEIARGLTVPNLDLAKPLTEAVGIVREARNKKIPVGDLIRQADLVSGQRSPEALAALRLFFNDRELRRPASRQRVADSLRFAAEEVRKNDPNPGLLGAETLSLKDILDLAKRRDEGGLLPAAAEMRSGPRQPLSLDDMQSRLDDALPATANMQPGGNYVGFVRQQANAAVPNRKTPIRREEVLAKLMADLNAALYQGRIKSDKVLGFFRKHIQEIRIKHPADLETAIHEVAHMLDDRFPEIRAQWFPASNANAAIRAELSGVSYDRTKLYEGFAEYVRLASTQPAEAQARAPIFHQWFERFLNDNPHGPAIREFQKGAQDWFGQSALDRARSKIGAAPDINSGLTDGIDGAFSKFRQSILDDLHGIERMEKDLTGKIEPVGAYETARLTRGKAAIIDGALSLGAPMVKPDGSHTFVGKGLKQILAPVAENLDDALMYFVGRSAAELKAQGREHLFTAPEIKAMLALKRPEFDTAFGEYQGWNNAILDFAEAKGIVNPVARQFFKRTQYLPFHRVGQGGAHQSVPGRWSGIKALTGGSENLRDVLGNMVNNAKMLLDAALTNEARVKVADLATSSQGGARFMARIPTEERGVRIPRDEVERSILEALGVQSRNQLTPDQQKFLDQIVKAMDPLVGFILRGQEPTGRNVVAVMKDGRPDFFEVADPLLFRSLSMLNRPTQGLVVRLAAIPRRIGQASVTLTADFMAANIFRDTIAAGVMSKNGFRPVLDSALGFASRLRQDPNYRDWVANGGGFASHLLEEEALKTNLKAFYGRKGIDYRTVLDTPRKLLYGLERIADSFEAATRLGEFARARAKGMHPRKAAFESREVSTDFAMRGDSATMGFFYDTVMFLKAGMVSMDRAYRGFARDPNRGAIAARTAIIAAMSAGLYMLNRGNPLYEDLEDWDRDGHWHVFVPTAETLRARATGQEEPPLEKRYTHLRLPKVWEIGAFSSIAERSLEAALSGQPVQGVKHAAKVIGNLFNLDYLPQAVLPLYELAINRDRFTNRPIETESRQQVQPWARSSPYTSRTMTALGEATRELPPVLQISPAQAEHLVRGYLNTWATYGLLATDAMLGGRSGPDMRLDQLPVVRRFYAQEPARSTKHLSELFKALNATQEAHQTARLMAREGRGDEASRMANSPENLQYGRLSAAQETMAGIRKASEAVYRLRGLPAVQNFAQSLSGARGFEGLPSRAQDSGAWGDESSLKRLILDDLTRVRNATAKQYMVPAEVQP